MARAGSIEKMRDLMDEEVLDPIQFKFKGFTTLTFPRKPLDNETTTITRKNGTSIPSNVPSKLGQKENRLYKLLKTLDNMKNSTPGSFPLSLLLSMELL